MSEAYTSTRRLILGAKLEFLRERELELWGELQKILQQKEEIQSQISNLSITNTSDQVVDLTTALSLLENEPVQEATTSVLEPVPAELLLHIFAFCVFAYSPSAVVDTRCQHPAVILSHVCRRWRGLALSTSSLWPTIIFGRKLRGVSTFLQRSGAQPLSIIHPYASSVTSSKLAILKQHLSQTSGRWKSIKWSSSELILKEIIAEVNAHGGTHFSHLSNLELSMVHRDRFSLTSRNAMWFPIIPNVHFPALSDIRLSYVLPSELPPSTNPTLRTFYLHYPMKTHAQWPVLAKISDVCAFLFRAPNLEELVFDDTVPLMDVRLSLDYLYGDSLPIDPGVRWIRSPMSPIILQKLTRFEWSFPPPKDAWRFFYFVQMPSLRRLDLVLNTPQIRWTQFYQGTFTQMDTAQLISENIVNPIIRFEKLDELRIETLDTDSLYQAFRKMDFPALKQLSLSFIHSEIKTPKLPRLESIFREPRMPTLKSLTINSFQIDQDEFRTALRYMPNLEHLTFDSCTKLDILSLLGNGGGSQHATSITLQKWVCPRLGHLTLINCKKTKFSALAEVVKSRKMASERAPGRPVEALEGRVFKPLRKRGVFHQIENRSHDSSVPFRAGVAPPSGSQSIGGGGVQDWVSNESVLPLAIKAVDIVGCTRVSEVELLSMKDKCHGVEEVYWSADQ